MKIQTAKLIMQGKRKATIFEFALAMQQTMGFIPASLDDYITKLCHNPNLDPTKY